jgi:hypothetical protein
MTRIRHFALGTLLLSSLSFAGRPKILDMVRDLNVILAPAKPELRSHEYQSYSYQIHASMPLRDGESFCFFNWDYSEDGSNFGMMIGTTADVEPSQLIVDFEKKHFRKFISEPGRLEFWTKVVEPSFLFVPLTFEKHHVRIERDEARQVTRVLVERNLTVPKTPILESDEVVDGSLECSFRDPPLTIYP